MARNDCELPNRTGMVESPPLVPASANVIVESTILAALAASGAQILYGQSDRAEWRVIDVVSDEPCAIEVRWGAGGAAHAVVRWMASRSGRICVFARSLDIRVTTLKSANVDTNPVKIYVMIGDGFQQTQNYWMTRFVGGPGGGPGPWSYRQESIPPFATHLLAEADDDWADLAQYVVQVMGSGAPGLDRINRYPFDNQPSSWLPLVAAKAVGVDADFDGNLRLVWRLAM
jgi:hypothetical protein